MQIYMLLSFIMLIIGYCIGRLRKPSTKKQTQEAGSQAQGTELAEKLRKINTYLSINYIDEDEEVVTEEVKIIDVLYSYATKSLLYLCQDDEGYTSVESVEAFHNPLDNGNQADRN